MTNLINQPEESKPELNEFSISHYMTEAELRIYREEVEVNQTEFGFTKRLQSKYVHRGGSKSGNTELRIAGSILNMIKAMLGSSGKRTSECRIAFTKADIARQIQNEEGEGISERTVQRYLDKVLTNLFNTYGICSEVKDGRNGCVYVWTAELESIEKSGQREFDVALINKTKGVKQREKLLLIQKERETKRSGLYYSKAKGENINKGSLIRLAFNLVRNEEIPHLKNFEVSNWDIVNLLVERLTAGEWRKSAWHAVTAALVFTDRAMTEYSIANPMGYARFNLRQRKVDKASKEALRIERLRYAKEGEKMAQAGVEMWAGISTTHPFELEMKENAPKVLLRMQNKVKHLERAC